MQLTATTPVDTLKFLHDMRIRKCGASWDPMDIRVEYHELRDMVIEPERVRDINVLLDGSHYEVLNDLAKIDQNLRSILLVVEESKLTEGPDDTLIVRSDVLTDRQVSGGLRMCPECAYATQPSAHARGTAFFIAPNVVATAAHVLITASNGLDVSRFRFVSGFVKHHQDDFLGAVVVLKSAVFKPTAGYVLTADAYEMSGSGPDWALVSVEPAYPAFAAANPLPANAVGIQTSPIEAFTKVYSLGHGLLLPTKVSYMGEVISNDLAKPYFEVSLTLLGGNSGSPVFNSLTHELVGIYTRGTNKLMRTPAGCLMVRNEVDQYEGQECQRITQAIQDKIYLLSTG